MSSVMFAELGKLGGLRRRIDDHFCLKHVLYLPKQHYVILQFLFTYF